MSEMPDDIWRKAGDAILKGGKAFRVRDDFHKAIAEALVAERERCAKMAEGYNIPALAQRLEGSEVINWTAQEIAQAIRKP